MTQTPPQVKICGITDVHDAELAVELGAWAVGMVFYDGSPRRCSTEQALRITTALRRRVELCGVFVDASLDELARQTEELGLTMLQLHGDEGPAFCAEARRRTGARVIKAIQVVGAGDVRELERYHVDFHLTDARARALAKRDLRGGTGETFDWSLLAERRSSATPLILSGGLHPGNVAEAAARVRPYAVDTASGTERAPGHKDEAKLRAFFAAVAATAARTEAPETPATDPVAAARTDPHASVAAADAVVPHNTPIESSRA
jgi:phosphoribosylanthranilate isomerase